MALTATVDKSVTSDEIAHLTAGRAYQSLGDYRLQPENGNLPQRWATLPMVLIQPHFPSLADDAWTDSDVWLLGHSFFYRLGNSTDWMLFAGRGMIALFSVGTGLLIFFWSRELFGMRGAFISLLLFVFCPNFLAHGALATSDVTMVFFMLAAVFAWWRQLDRLTWGRWALSSLVLGLAFAAKFSAVLLLPMIGLMALARCLVPMPLAIGQRGCAVSVWEKTRWVTISTLGHFFVVWVVVWAFYGFRYSAFASEASPMSTGFNRPWEWVLPHIGLLAEAVNFARKLKLLPEAFLYGFSFVTDFAQQRGAFLNGNYSIYGWWYFFPYAFLVKTPPSVLLLMILGSGIVLTKCIQWPLSVWTAIKAKVIFYIPLISLFLVYGAFSIRSHLNIGHRHILPLYPVLFILLGGFGSWLSFNRPIKLICVASVLAWTAIESLNIRPDYLAYFNFIGGGPSKGYRHLIDSSLDWGQDLPGLSAWLRSNNSGQQSKPVFLSYFGTGNPSYEGITATLMLALPESPPRRPWYWFKPGLYCISATMLQHVYSPFNGSWSVSNEREYRHLSETDPLFHEYKYNLARRKELEQQISKTQWQSAWNRFEQLRFARLCQYLRARQPDSTVGYSILVYDLTAEELDIALNRDLKSLVDSIKQFEHQAGRL